MAAPAIPKVGYAVNDIMKAVLSLYLTFHVCLNAANFLAPVMADGSGLREQGRTASLNSRPLGKSGRWNHSLNLADDELFSGILGRSVNLHYARVTVSDRITNGARDLLDRGIWNSAWNRVISFDSETGVDNTAEIPLASVTGLAEDGAGNGSGHNERFQTLRVILPEFQTSWRSRFFAATVLGNRASRVFVCPSVHHEVVRKSLDQQWAASARSIPPVEDNRHRCSGQHGSCTFRRSLWATPQDGRPFQPGVGNVVSGRRHLDAH